MISRYFKVFFISFFVFMMLYLSFIGIKNMTFYNRFKLELSDLDYQLKQEQSKHQELTDIFNFMNDPYYWDLQARRNLGYTKKNEKVYKFVYQY